MCELDIIFNFEKAYFMLDEFMLAGEVQETSKKNVLKAIAAQDIMQEVSTSLQISLSLTLFYHFHIFVYFLDFRKMKNRRVYWKNLAFTQVEESQIKTFMLSGLYCSSIPSNEIPKIREYSPMLLSSHD